MSLLFVVLPIKIYLLLQNSLRVLEKMNFSESCKGYTSSNSPSWFENFSLEGYKIPITLNLPFVTSQKGNFTDEEKKKITGGSIDKAVRVDIFLNKNRVPSPTKYFPAQKENKQQITNSVNPSFYFKSKVSKTQTFRNKFPNAINYNADTPQTIICPKIDKATNNGYFDGVQAKAILMPGPTDYNPKLQRHKSLSLFSKAKKDSFLDLRISQKKSIGPHSYNIPRSNSVICPTKLKLPLKQSDLNLVKKTSNRNIQKLGKGTKGAYLNLDEWCKYKGNRRLPSTLTVCSKPLSLKVYH